MQYNVFFSVNIRNFFEIYNFANSMSSVLLSNEEISTKSMSQGCRMMKQSKYYFPAIFFTVLASAVTVLYDFTLIPVFQALLNLSLDSVFFSLIVMLGGILVMLIAICLQEYYQSTLITDVPKILRNNIIGQANGYEISSLINDMDLLEKNYFIPFLQIVEALTNFIVALISIIFMHWALVVLSLASFLLMMGISVLLEPYSKKMIEDFSDANQRFVQTITDCHQGNNEYRLFHIPNRFRSLHKKIRIIFYRYNHLSKKKYLCPGRKSCVKPSRTNSQFHRSRFLDRFRILSRQCLFDRQQFDRPALQCNRKDFSASKSGAGSP
ncbi:MAG: hypothetical protein SOY75_00395 [Peptoniphilaceae bacterium]|nr:hypothetical protein [Peptoniphilaceae bacterium]